MNIKVFSFRNVTIHAYTNIMTDVIVIELIKYQVPTNVPNSSSRYAPSCKVIPERQPEYNI